MALRYNPPGVHFVCCSSMVNTDLFRVLFSNFQAIEAFACGGKTMDKLQMNKNVVVWIENTGKLRKRTLKSFKYNRPLYLNEFLSLAPFIFPNPRQPFHKVFIFLKFFLSLVDL